MTKGIVLRGCPGSEPPPSAVHEPVPTAFLDRDGVLNVDRGYVCNVSEFEWVPGALEAVKRLHSAGYRVVVATNQSGVGRGLYTEDQFLSLTNWMLERAPFDAVVYCPHAPEAGCPARKPGTAMLEAVDRYLGVDKDNSFFVGDKSTDIEAGEAFGIRGLLFDGQNLDEFLRKTALA